MKVLNRLTLARVAPVAVLVTGLVAPPAVATDEGGPCFGARIFPGPDGGVFSPWSLRWLSSAVPRR